MHVTLQAWRGPSSAFLQLVSVSFPVTRIRTPPGQAWNIFIALLYLTSASAVVLTTSSVLGKPSALYSTSFSNGLVICAGIAVIEKLIVRPEALGGNFLTKDDFDWNQTSSADIKASFPIWEVSFSAHLRREPSFVANYPYRYIIRSRTQP